MDLEILAITLTTLQALVKSDLRDAKSASSALLHALNAGTSLLIILWTGVHYPADLNAVQAHIMMPLIMFVMHVILFAKHAVELYLLNA